jgi:hypothetical protein
LYESLRMSWSDAPYFTPGFPLITPLVHTTRIASLSGPATGSFAALDVDPIVSDTGQLKWIGSKQKQGVVAIDTPRSQAIVGFAKANPQQTGQLAAQLETPFAAITLTSLDEKAIAQSPRLLLTATGRVANSGMQWNAKRTSLESWGKTPVRIEPIVATVTLRQLDNAKSVSVQPLDGAGHALGKPIEAAKSAHDWTFKLGTPASVWYIVSVAR